MKQKKHRAVAKARRAAGPGPGSIGAVLRELGLLLATLLVLQVGLVQAYHVPTGSMEQTIHAGDYLLAEKLTLGPRTPHWVGIPFTSLGLPVPALKLPGLRAPRAGDIVVVEVPLDERTPYVKRVVATGGQTVELRDKRLYVDGEPARLPGERQHSDPFSFRPQQRTAGIDPELGNRDNWGPWTVPEGQLFLMGDNRDNSHDSRWFGAVPRDAVIGRAWLVTLSLSGEGAWPWAKLRLDRSLRLLH